MTSQKSLNREKPSKISQKALKKMKNYKKTLNKMICEPISISCSWPFISNFSIIIFFIDFLEELGLFIKENPDFYKKKKIRRSAGCRDFMAVQMKNFVRSLFERCIQVRDFTFWITEGIGLTGVSFHF
jgi:hypothetical protein